MVGILRKKESEAEKDITKQNEPVLVGFQAAYVFDVSMTEGKPLPNSKTGLQATWECTASA